MAKEIHTFEDFKLNKQILTAISEAGFTIPTEIQKSAIAPILAGQDVMGIAQTGTGKTAAYTIPLLRKLGYPQGHDLRALVIVPTRELVLQVKSHIDALATHTGLRCVGIYGGVGPTEQKKILREGLDILVSTPQRVMEFYLDKTIVFKSLHTLVLDEAERLMDMGFMRQLNRIFEVIPSKRQNLLFSATMSDKVMKLSEDFLTFPTIIRAQPERLTASTVSQKVYFTPNIKTKINLLDDIITKNVGAKSMIFCKTRAMANNIHQYVARKMGDEKVKVLHSNKGQHARINSIKEFTSGAVTYLVSTDVAARGIDVDDIAMVINFDVPLIYEDYVHRIGRTGRAQKKGASITFCSPADEYHLEKIKKIINEKIPARKVPAELIESKTPFEEQQVMAREIDSQRKREDPNYQGAFHESKRKRPPVKTKSHWKKKTK